MSKQSSSADSEDTLVSIPTQENSMNRRSFIRNTAAGALAAKFGSASMFAAGEDPAGAEKMRRIAVTTWSLHTLFPQTKEKDAPPGETLDMRKFPELVADR